jgi:signal transduction histidine kinase
MKKLSEQAIRAREEAIASVSHDLKNPLSAILMTIQLLTSKRLSSEQQETVFENSIKTIKIASNQMKNLIGDLLDYTKLESGRLKIEKKEEDVSSILTEVVGIFEPIAKSRRLDLFSENAAGIAKVTCERKRIIRVLSNLINNAIKFTPSGGRVTISAELKNGEALFVVRDTGTGITSEQLPHIFERYWQADETARKGTGLGLAIAKGFVEVHNGKIWVESQPGYGSTFFFTIPLAEKLEKIA